MRHNTSARRSNIYAAQAITRWPDYTRAFNVDEVNFPTAAWGDIFGDAAGIPGATGTMDWSKVGEAAVTVLPSVIQGFSNLGGKKRKEAEAQVALLQQQLMQQQAQPLQTQSNTQSNTPLYIGLGIAGLLVLGGGLYLATRK